MNAFLPVFESTLQKSNLWLKDLSTKMGSASSQEAYQALRTVLHALRDRLTVDESAEFAAQMPMLIRGMYFEGWNPGSEATFERSREAFLDDVVDRFDGRWKDSPEQLVRTVLASFQSGFPLGRCATWPTSSRNPFATFGPKRSPIGAKFKGAKNAAVPLRQRFAAASLLVVSTKVERSSLGGVENLP